MNFKRIIFALLYSNGNFYLSRNFRLQKVGGIEWLKNNFGFGETCNFIDELIVINITKDPTENDFQRYFKDINILRKKLFVPVILGGGIRKLEHAKACFENGADKILVNYLAHKNKNILVEIANIYGKQAISVMVDYKKENDSINTFINGGKIFSQTLTNYIASLKELNFGELILNSIDRDGTASGFDLESPEFIIEDFDNPILVMGGAGKPEHFKSILNEKKISGAITANLFNFLGKGLERARNYSIQNKIKLINFS